MANANRYAALPDSDGKRWSVVDRQSNDNAPAKVDKLTGLSKVVAIVWADRLNSQEDGRSL
jgi:hypothetical protein